ncbi:MAG: hypothetical protein JW932_03680 [Deltaproteobacteria bacterium]|nr:hypothetical protein [Deltaproteobacteria bacterium]
MNQIDEWGKDPSVQIMRRVFKAMEAAQARLLHELGISLYDLRIRAWREKALALFERAWVSANRIGLDIDECFAYDIYIYAMAEAIYQDGIEVPSDLLPAGEEVKRVFSDLRVGN